MWNPFKRKGKPDSDPFRYKDYPGGGPYKEESLDDYHARMWENLDQSIKTQAVAHLHVELSPVNREEWRKRIEADPEDWMLEEHHFAGMAFRNLLRKAVTDNELPTGNWDDYYVSAIEVACGVRAS
jgi:hypothetical protein